MAQQKAKPRQVGNENNMAAVRKMMEEEKLKNLTDEVNQGGDAENVVTIDYTSDEGLHYEGKILFKRPTVMEVMKMGGRKSEILRNAGVTDLTLVDPSIRMMAQSIATLEVVVVKCPEWLLNLEEVTDLDMLFHIYGRYEGWENSFRLRNIAKQAGNGEASERQEDVASS